MLERDKIDTPYTHMYEHIDTPYTHMHEHSLSWHGAGTSIKSGWVKLVLWSQRV